MLRIRPLRVESERVRPSVLDKKTTSRTRHWSPTPSRRRQRIWRHTCGTGARSAHAEEPRPFRLRVGPQTSSFDQFLRPHGGRISSGPVLLDADERDKVRQMLFLKNFI